MRKPLVHALAVGLPALLLGSIAASCGGSGGGGGGFSSTTAGSTSAGTTPGGGSGPGPSAPVATVESLRVAGSGLVAGTAPPALVTGDLAVAFAVAHPNATATDVEVAWSKDQGATWSVATPASGSVALAGLATGPAPGVEHVFRWDTARDVPGFEADVRVRVAIAGGGSARQSASFAVDNQPVSTHVTLNRWPYLQAPVAGEALVAWRTETPTDSVIEWGTTPALGQTAGDPQASEEEHWVNLTGLQPGTTYYYRVSAGGRPITQRQSFRSAPGPSVAAMKFVVVGDSGMGNPEQYSIARLMQAENADFLLHTGDIVYPAGGFPLAVGEYNNRFFKPYQDMVGKLFSFPVVGNHDLYGLFGEPYKQTFAVPANRSGLFEELYFSFEWGDAKFVAIESNTIFQFIPFGHHIGWLQQELTRNTKKWLIVYMHAPLYSCGSHGDNARLQRLLEPMFEANKVDLVLAGHDHNYERTVPIKAYNQDPAYPGLVHVTTGGGGASLRAVNPNQRTAVALSVHHYVRMNIQGDDLTGEAVDINGQVVDRFTVRNQ